LPGKTKLLRIDNTFEIVYVAGFVVGSVIRWLWAIAQVLLIHNWIAGPAFLVIFLPLYFLRVPREENLMLETFKDQYRQYMHKTGRIIPRLWQ